MDIIGSIDDQITLSSELIQKLDSLLDCLYNKYLNETKKDNFILLKELLRFEKGTEPGEDNYHYSQKENSIKHYRVADLNKECNTFIFKNLTNITTKYGEILVSFDGSPGKIAMNCNGSYSGGIRKITSKSNQIPNWFIYCIFKSKYTQTIINKYSTGSNILHASESINYLDAKINHYKIEKFNNHGTYVYSKIVELYKKIDLLRSYKAILLPLILNEQVL